MQDVVAEKSEEYWKKTSFKRIAYNLLQIIIGLPKSIVFNLKYFGLKGVKLPVLLSYKVKLHLMKGSVRIPYNSKTGDIKLGFTAPEMYDNRKLSFVWINDGRITFEGKAGIRNGSSIRNYSDLTFGDDFHVAAPSKIICYKKITFGRNTLIGWNCEIVDGDAHKIYSIDDESCEVRLNPNREVKIGDNVWLAANVKILKGVQVGNNVVIAAGTVMSKSFDINNAIIGGNPPSILKKNIFWRV